VAYAASSGRRVVLIPGVLIAKEVVTKEPCAVQVASCHEPDIATESLLMPP
jgi:hypothetical protein